ncbi:MAG: MFS transporter [Deltaproteobacteria bacterium]|jgi:predicted MFS family arabinose efflux permease|nr:MFS transporter [Deltaproteobacteria bacterium]
MSTSVDAGPAHLTQADRPAAIVACVGLAILGFSLFMGMPILVGALVDDFGFSEEQVGYLAAADLGGMFVASIATSLLVTRVDRRMLASAGIFAAILCNLLSLGENAFWTLLPIRFLAGTGAGLAYAIAVAVLAGSHHTARNYTYLIFGQVLTNALILYTFPHISGKWGANGIFVAYCAVFSAGLVFVFWLPRYFDAMEQERVSRTEGVRAHFPSYLCWLCLIAVFGFYFMIGAYWAYIERIGVHLGFDPEFIGLLLAVFTVFSLIGCAAAYWLSRRCGQSRPLLGALLTMLSVLSLHALGINVVVYFVGLVAIFLLWNFIDIYQLGTIANIDHSGRYAALLPAAQGLSMAAGPAAGGFLLGRGFGYEAVMGAGAASVALALVAYGVVHSRLRSLSPSLAYEQ